MFSLCALLTACRTCALHKHRPISLHPTIQPPSLDKDPSDRPIAAGLELMINMFKIVDDTFVNVWNRGYNTRASAAWITQVHIQLSKAIPARFEYTEVQKVRFHITKQWLRAKIWQISVLEGLVTSVSDNILFTFRYPIDIARDLFPIVQRSTQQAREVHSAVLVSKFLSPCVSASTLEIVSAQVPPFLVGTIRVIFRSHYRHGRQRLSQTSIP